MGYDIKQERPRRKFEPYTVDFGAQADGALGPGWTAPGTALVTGGELLITPALGAELYSNPGLEAPYAAGLASGWTKYGAGTLAEETILRHGGGSSQKVATTAIDQYAAQPVALPADQFILFQQWFRKSAGTWWTYWRFDATNLEDWRQSDFIVSNDTWTRLVATPYAKATGATGLRLVNGSDSSLFYLDDASARPLTLNSCLALRKAAGRRYRVLGLPGTANPPARGGRFGVAAAVDDPAQSSPPNMMMALHDGDSTLKLIKRVDGHLTELIAQASSYNAASAVEIRRQGDAWTLYYGGAQVGAAQTVPGMAGKFCGLVNFVPGTGLKSLQILAN